VRAFLLVIFNGFHFNLRKVYAVIGMTPRIACPLFDHLAGQDFRSPKYVLPLRELIILAYNNAVELTEKVDKPGTTSFKTCTKCRFVWSERTSFLRDPGLRMVGYQPHFDSLMAGFFLFTHTCGTTLAVQVGDFQDLYSGPIFTERLNGTENCPGYCLHEDELRPCPAHCKYAYVREIGQVILRWRKL
jgi:hypothetical protein